jgi:hypothetical protein
MELMGCGRIGTVYHQGGAARQGQEGGRRVYDGRED